MVERGDEGALSLRTCKPLIDSLTLRGMAVSEVRDTDSTCCSMLSSDALAGVMALAHPRDAAVFAQSCKDLHILHQALKANLRLDELQLLSSRHILGVAPDTAYVQLLIPDELILLADRQLTASQEYSLALALRPEQSRIQSFVQRLFRDNPSCTLGLKMLVPASINMIDRRNALARILRALVSIVTQDLKAAISIHAQAAQQPTPFKVFYDFDVIIQHLHGQGLEELYSETEQRFGESLAHQLFQKVVATCGVTGKKMEYISWKETGLAVLFGQLPSTQQHDPTLGVSTIDCEESGSAQLWAFTSLASQVVPVDRMEQVIDWL